MVAKIRATVGKIRTQIKSMEVGVEFEGEGDEGEESEGRSNLELKNPENLEELAVMTEVDMFFNVTDNESDDRAFLMYIGNEVGYRVTMVVAHLGWVDPDLEGSPGWWAVTAAMCCPTGGWNIPNLRKPNPGVRPPWSPCMRIWNVEPGQKPSHSCKLPLFIPTD